MNHINQAKALAAKTRLVNLIAAASVGTTALICTGGFAQAGSEAMVSLSIEGRALNQPMPNAIVAVYAGGQKFSTRADAKGAYRLNVRLPANKTAGLVQISAQGVAAQAGLGLVSYPGSFAAMVAQAGRDGVLTVGENPRVQLTAISSAEAALVRDAAGKRPETDEEQASALKAVDVVELLDLAATLQLMASEPAQYRLPKGVPNTLEFLTQRGPREDYVDILQTQAPDILERAQLQLLQDPEQRPAIVAATLPSEMLAVQSRPAPQQVAVVRAKGSKRQPAATAWAVSQGQMKVMADAPARHETTAWLDTNADGKPDADVRLVHQVVETKLSLIGNGMGVVTTRSLISHPSHPQLADETETTLRAVRVFAPQQDMMALRAPAAVNGG